MKLSFAALVLFTFLAGLLLVSPAFVAGWYLMTPPTPGELDTSCDLSLRASLFHLFTRAKPAPAHRGGPRLLSFRNDAPFARSSPEMAEPPVRRGSEIWCAVRDLNP